MSETIASADSGSRVRRFTLLDLMILVGTMAVGFALTRLPEIPFGMRNGGSLRYNLLVMTYIAASTPFLAALTISCLIMSLRGPRPRFHLLSQQPGFVACAAGLVALMYEFLWLLCYAIKFGVDAANRGFLTTKDGYLIHVGTNVAPWVAAAWLSLALGRRWVPERIWIDCLGIAIGVAWIVAGIVIRGSVLLLWW